MFISFRNRVVLWCRDSLKRVEVLFVSAFSLRRKTLASGVRETRRKTLTSMYLPCASASTMNQPALTNHFLPVIMERVQQVVTPIDNPSLVTPMVTPATTNEEEVDHVVSSDEGIP
ncbi:hypothetical protein H5410_050521 [Solanum commersonii]|uniref:Uncharacterized protein n=1 Tax=Solanum commersonii TaxID=4109 RepID=A0A9J5WY53_SOLCO|nr:hypothetical protein H5410_050521 [Solanum commersonii]